MKEQILAVQRMQDYIEAHLEETVGLSDLAKVSLFSPWHSHRLFQEYTGLTPANYIRRLRLAVRHEQSDGNRIGSIFAGAHSELPEKSSCKAIYAAKA